MSGRGFMDKPGIYERGLTWREVFGRCPRLELRTWGEFAIKGLENKPSL